MNIVYLSSIVFLIIILLFIMMIFINTGKNNNFVKVGQKKKQRFSEDKKKVAIDCENPFTNEIEKHFLCNKKNYGCEHPKFKHSCCVTNGIIMMKDVFEILRKYKIYGWVTNGTAEGYKYYKGFKPTESKIEISICENQFMENICKELEDKEYYIECGINKYTVYYSETNNLNLDIYIEDKINIKKAKMYDIDIYIPTYISSEIYNFQKDKRGKIVQDIDVLFIGNLDERRKKIYFEIMNSERLNYKNIVFKNDVIGVEKELLISRSKIVLNIHRGNCKILERVRLSHLLANSKCVISERSSETEIDYEWADGVIFCEYEEIVNKIIFYLEHDKLRKKQEEYGNLFIKNKIQKLPIRENPFLKFI